MRTSGSRWKTAGNVNAQQEQQQQGNEKELNSQQTPQVKEVKPSSATSKSTTKPIIKSIPLANKKPLPVKSLKSDASANNPMPSDGNAITQKLPIQMQKNLSRPTSASSLKNVKITKPVPQLLGKENDNNQILRQNKQSENGSKSSLNRTSSNTTNTIPNIDVDKRETREKAEDSIKKEPKELRQSEMTVAQFLESIQLLQYKEVFEENGFDDLDTVIELNSAHMDQMKIPMGHQIKITKKIKALKEEGDESSTREPNSVQIMPSRPISGLPLEKRTDLEELEPPSAENEEDEFDDSYYYNEKKNVSKGEQSNQLQDNNDLRNGSFNEEESHQTFLEALMQFRSQGVKEEKQINSSQQSEAQANTRQTTSRSSLTSRKDSTRKKSVRFTENISIDEKKKGNEEQEEQNKIEQPQTVQKPGNVNKESSNQSNLKETDKCSCYNCFKLISLLTIDKEQVIHASSTSNFERYFCSVSCKDSYALANNVTCICGRQQPKESCFLSILKGKWTCSQNCLEFLESEQPNYTQEQNNSSANFTQEDNQLRESSSKEQRTDDLKMQFKQENEDTDQYQGGVDLDFSSPKRGILSLAELEDLYKQK